MHSTIRAWVAVAFLATACGAPVEPPGTEEESDATLDAADLRGGDALYHYRKRHRHRRHPQPTYCTSFGWWKHRVDLSSSEWHCGACGRACAAGESCVSGTCTSVCEAGLVSCTAGGAAVCTDVSSDPANCGGCGIACGPNEVCVSGARQPACAPGLAACGDPGATTCVDLLADARNCGACDNACAGGYACDGGSCVLQCGAGLEACGGTCVDPLADGQNCGGCGNACADGRACLQGVCTLQCAAGLDACGGECVDPSTNSQNCGGCGIACAAGEACESRTCAIQCAASQIRCENASGLFCTDGSSDGANCGRCGNACSAGTICVSGTCQVVCDGATVACDGVCKSVASDPANCGACGTTCSGGTPVCENGECVPEPLASSYEASVIFADAIGVPVTTLGFDGSYYWSYGSYSRRGTKTQIEGQYATDGTLVRSNFNQTVELNSIFSPGGDGRLHARYAGYMLVYRMNLDANGLSTGAFSYLVTLSSAGALLADGSLAMTADGAEFLGFANGNTISRWSSTGTFLGSIALTENGSPASAQNGRIALAHDGSILTYSNGFLSVWDRATGARVRTVTLVGAGTTAQSHYSFSYANGMVWILDDTGLSWRGYAIGQ
jgi:hypothetical protein